MRPYLHEVEVPSRLSHPPLGSLREVGLLKLELRDLDRLGQPHSEDDPEEVFKEYGSPPNPGREWWLRSRCGMDLVLWQDFVTEAVTVGAEETAELDHVLAHLPFDHEVLWRFPPMFDEEERRRGKGGWVVYRLDDRGNHFEMGSFSLEPSARCFAALMEARRHKQSYFVERKEELPPAPAREPLPHRWALVRQDDNGHRVVVRRGPHRYRLESLAEWFNREPRHKQTFFVEPYAPAE